MKRLAWIIGCLWIVTSLVFAVSDRYLVEDNLTKLAQTSLDAMFGKDNFIVRVQVQMTESKYSVKYTQESSLKKKGSKKQEQVYILPGVPALKNLSPGALNKLPYDSVTSMVEPKVRRMLVYVLANKAYPRSQARKAEAVLKEVLRLQDGRDTVKMVYKKFYEDPNKKTQSITIVPGPEKILSIQNLFYLVVTLLLIVMMILYVLYQRKLLAKESSGGDGGGASINVNPNLELPEGLGGGSGGPSNINMNANIKRYFDFVTDANILDFVFLVSEQDLKEEYICNIVSFLPRHLAAQLLTGLDTKKQAVVAVMLADQRLASKDVLDKLETKLKADLECFVGGGDKVSALVDALSSTQRKAISDQAKTDNAAGHAKIRPYIILFEDILLLEETELQNVLSELNLEQLAVALVDVDQELFSRIMENLTRGATDLVNQYLELKSGTSTPDQIDKARDAVVKVLQRMDKDGKVALSEKLKGA